MSLASWRAATVGIERTPRRINFFVIFSPVLAFLVVAMVLFRRLMDSGIPMIAAEISAELGEMDAGLFRVEAARAAAEAIAWANWWTLVLVSALLLGLAIILMVVLGALLRLIPALVPRSRADLRVYLEISRRERRSLLPALWTAASLFLIWLVVEGVAMLSGGELNPSDVLLSGGILLGGLLLFLVAHKGILLGILLRRWKVPREHLLRHLALSLTAVMVLGLLPALASAGLFGAFPKMVETVVDRPVVRSLEAELRSLAGEYDVPPAALLQGVEALPLGLQPQRASLVRQVTALPPLHRGLEVVGWMIVGLLVLFQLLLGYLAPGPSRWIWPVCGVAGAVFAATVLGGGELTGARGRLWLLGSWIALFATLMIFYVLAVVPSPSGPGARAGDLAAERRRLQGTLRPIPGGDLGGMDPVIEVYRRVGCSLGAP